MPLYEYRCEDCGREFTRIARISERDEQECEPCGTRPTRIVSGGGFILRGDGWARDGYAKSDRKL
mgnify:FL=1